MGIVVPFPSGRFMLAQQNAPADQPDRFEQMNRLLRSMPGTPLHEAGRDMLRSSLDLFTADAARFREGLMAQTGADPRDHWAIDLAFSMAEDIRLLIDVDPEDAAMKLRMLVQRYEQMKALTAA